MVQTIIVILIVSAAVGYMAWHAYKHFFAKNSACEGCAMSKAQSGTISK